MIIGVKKSLLEEKIIIYRRLDTQFLLILTKYCVRQINMKMSSFWLKRYQGLKHLSCKVVLQNLRLICACQHFGQTMLCCVDVGQHRCWWGMNRCRGRCCLFTWASAWRTRDRWYPRRRWWSPCQPEKSCTERRWSTRCASGGLQTRWSVCHRFLENEQMFY